MVGGEQPTRQETTVNPAAEKKPAAYTVAAVMRPAATTVETQGHLAAAAYLMTHADQGAHWSLSTTSTGRSR